MLETFLWSHFAGRCNDSRCWLYTCTLGSGSDHTTESLGWNVERWNRNRPRYRSLASWVTLTFTPGHSGIKPSIICGGHGVHITIKEVFQLNFVLQQYQIYVPKVLNFYIKFSQYTSNCFRQDISFSSNPYLSYFGANISTLIFFSENRFFSLSKNHQILIQCCKEFTKNNI